MFANVENIKDYFLNIKQQSQFLSSVYNFFETKNIEFGFLGGAVRAAINGSEEPLRDLDIVFDSDDIGFDNFLIESGIDFRTNSFGGRKVKTDNLVFDIWSLSRHHLIAEKKYSRNFKSISKTTFVNYDSIFFDWTKQKLIGDYSKCLQTHLIDFVGNKKYQKLNKQVDVAICKLALLSNQKFSLSKDVENYVSNYIRSFFDKESLFDRNDFFDGFIYNYNRHCDFKLDVKTRDIIYKFVISYL